MTIISLDLPMPPSTNNIWRSNRGRVHRSGEYAIWEARARAAFLMQKRSINKICGQFDAVLVLNETKMRSNWDCNNRDKAVLDFAKAMDVIIDDSIKYMRSLHCRLGDNATAPEGCRLILTPLRG